MAPAPDLPPPIRHAPVNRPLAAHLTTSQADPADLAGATVIMIDALRASTTIAAALHAGATSIQPVLTVEEALHLRSTPSTHSPPQPPPLLGGERAGRLIPGFDLGNSPRDYTRERIAGRRIIFTTTNGTAALLHAANAGAADVLIGALTNLSAICAHAAADERAVHLLCAGTRDKVTLDDAIAAGAMVERLVAAGRSITSGDGGDAARLCLAAWHLAEEDLREAMLASRGGRNLAAVGLQRDVLDCCEIDAYPVVPRFDPASGLITAA